MNQAKVVPLAARAELEAKTPLEHLITQGARKMLQTTIENEVHESLQAYRGQRTEDDRAAVVRNGYLPERDLVTGVGPVKVRQPRVRHWDGQQFTSAILPEYSAGYPASMP